MYILKLSPVFKDYLWGGTRLREDFGYQSDLPKIAEAWVLSCHKDGQSIVVNGQYQGLGLEEALRSMGEGAAGTNAKRFPYFPVLIKLIDAKDNLSVQVHPDNDYARRVEHEFGKTEAWYVLDCEEDASLIYGFKEKISSEDFRKSIEDNMLLDVLNTVPVKKGDLFFIEAGTVHAIGKGVLIAEIQQNSNSTYRVYDYNRLGADGKPRELHVNKAVDVSVTEPPRHAVKPQGAPIRKDGYTQTLLVKCDLFQVTRYELTKGLELNADEASFISLLVVEGSGVICGSPEELSFQKGDSFFVPAGYGSFALEGNAVLLATTI